MSERGTEIRRMSKKGTEIRKMCKKRNRNEENV